MIHFETYNHKFTNVILLEKYSYCKYKYYIKRKFHSLFIFNEIKISYSYRIVYYIYKLENYIFFYPFWNIRFLNHQLNFISKIFIFWIYIYITSKENFTLLQIQWDIIPNGYKIFIIFTNVRKLYFRLLIWSILKHKVIASLS